MRQKTLRTLVFVCLLVAAVGAFTLMLKNPEDNFLNIPTFLAIMVAIALMNLRPTK